MAARLKPLDGKYYGTIIELFGGDLEGQQIDIWLRTNNWKDGTMEPSDRELAYGEETRAEHEEVKYHGDDCCADLTGGHYETRISYQIAMIIVNAINNAKP